jgi:hypothetical protein
MMGVVIWVIVPFVVGVVVGSFLISGALLSRLHKAEVLMIKDDEVQFVPYSEICRSSDEV